jgi:hypothetical protein
MYSNLPISRIRSTPIRLSVVVLLVGREEYPSK